MIKQLLITLTAWPPLLPAYTQVAPTIEWQRALGGSAADDAAAVAQSDDGGYIIIGNTSSNNGDVSGFHGSVDAWTVKLDGSGVIEWQRSLGGSGDDRGFAVQQTTDHGYIIAAYTTSNDGDVTGFQGAYDAWIVKLDASGTLQWQRTLGGSAWDRALAIQQTTDGGYIMAGMSNSNDGDVSGNHGGSDEWVVKLSDVGAIQWQRSLGGSLTDQANAVRQTSEGGYVVFGYSNSSDGDVTGLHFPGTADEWIVKLDAGGSIIWEKALGGTPSDQSWDGEQTTDGGYATAGESDSNNGDVSGNHGSTDAWIVHLNSSGDLQWQRAMGGTGEDWATSIQEINHGKYIVGGFTGSDDGDVSGNHGGTFDAWAVELDTANNIQWQKAMGGSDIDKAIMSRQTADNGFIIAGYTFSNDGDVSGNHGNGDMWVVKLSSEGSNEGIEDNGAISWSVAPNPCEGAMHVRIPTSLQDARITLTDALGREVLHERMSGTNCTLDLGDQPRGLYLLTLRSTQGISSQRVVVE